MQRMSPNDHQVDASTSLRPIDLDLFGNGIPEAPERITGLERHAHIAVELLRCKTAWIDAPSRLSTRYPRKSGRKGAGISLEDILGALFAGGMPDELTILTDLDLRNDQVATQAGGFRFLIASPLTASSGAPIGVFAVADTKPRQLSTEQIDSFKGLVSLASEEIERKLPVTTAMPGALPTLLNGEKAASSAGIAEDFLECSVIPAWVTDIETRRFLAVNKAAIAAYGYSREEFFELSSIDALCIEEHAVAPGVSLAARTATHCGRDGHEFDVELVSLSIVYDGKPAALQIVRDISEWRFIADRSRFESSVLSQISDAVIAVDLDFRITYWNHVAEQMYDWTASDVMGKRLPDVLQPDWSDPDMERDASVSLLADGRWSGETIHHRRSGEEVHIESSATAIRASDNRVIGFFCLNRDITDRKKMEVSLQENEQRYRSLFDFHPDAVVWIDLDGKFLSANLACKSILGYIPDELIGMSFLPLVDPKDRVRALEMFERAIHGEPTSYEYIGLHKSGRKVNLGAVALPVIIDGQIVGVYAISQDIGERKRLQGIISAENEVLQWLAANKPLHAIIDRLINNIEERYDALRCTVTVLSDDRRREVVTAPGVSERARDYLVQHATVPPNSTVAQAIRSRARSISTNIGVDRNAEDQREFAALVGAGAVCTTPIIATSGDVLGTFSLFLKESRPPTAEELNIADRAATLLRIAIESDRAHLRLSLTERAMDSTVASVVIADPNKPDRPIIYVNQAFERITGFREEDVVGRSASFLHGPETDPAQLAEIENAISHQRECNVLVKYYTADGSPYWCSSSISPIRDAGGRLTHYIEVQNDVTSMMQALDSARESEQRFRHLIENASDMVLVLEESGSIRYVSPAIERIMGYHPDEVIGRDIFEFVHPEDLLSTRTLFLQLLDSTEKVITVELRNQRKDGTWCHIEATTQNLLEKPGVRGIVVNARDLSERKLANDRLDHLAYHDVLTDLPNRLLFNDHLTKAIANARRRAGMVAVLFLDLDRFKVINDTLGHSVGDQLLQHVAERLVTTAREGDTVARWGGDEFTIILTSVSNARDAARVAQRVIGSLSEPFLVAGHELYITATVGISMFPNAGDDVETLVRNADTAMYRAKEEGQNHYQFYTHKMNAGASERLALESRLRRALEREEFVLHYQPQIDSRTGKITGAEALVRWQHPDLGLVPPKEFIPLAEETGLIVPIGDWIMREACRQAKIWQDSGVDKLRVAVNLSARQFSQRDLHQMVERMLKDTGADPTWLELELTESLLINCENRVVAAMKDLAAIGVSVSIDDFGVGYSSYSYLKRYPVSALKIEQSFVKGMLVDAHDHAIVQSIITMAHKLNLHVIAEGVETKAQSELLVSSQCDLMQGFHFGRPMEAADFTKLVAKQYAASDVVAGNA
jgi:diguanylate cyclase (GGDEF)-like protein/PAS domain S-box-containing protein